jgi:hypothetical protein
MITNTTTFVLLAERRADVGTARGSRTVLRPVRGRLGRIVLRLTTAAGFPRAWSPLNVSSAAVDPRPAHSSQG